MRSRPVCAFVVLLLVCAVSRLEPGSARAAEAAPVTFTEVGVHTFTVPANVKSIHVVATGAPGGSGGFSGGPGGVAIADVAVTPGQVLNVYVGGEGEPSSASSPKGGFNGGGDGATIGGASGGGASDIRTGGPTDFASRLVIAGGGGGGGLSTKGGAAGESGGSATECSGGGAGTAQAGGAGGKGAGAANPGVLGEGGDGNGSGGAGGGGGLFGGGAGGAKIQPGVFGSETCGGGGGSSGFGAGTSATSTAIATTTAKASVVITYSPVAPEAPIGPGSPGTGGGTAKATLSLPAVQHGESVVGTVKIPANRSSLKAELLWQKKGKKKPLTVGRLVEAGLKKGLHSFTVDLNSSGRKKLAALGKLKLNLAVRVIPPQGAVATATRKVTLKP